MPDPPRSVRDLIDRHPWHVTLPRLRRYAAERTGRLTWAGFRRGPLPGVRQVDDVVNTAIEKVLTGIRIWDPYREPDLALFLESVVDSEVSHLIESWDHRHIRPAAALPRDAEREEEDLLVRVPSPAPGPAEALDAREGARRQDDFFKGFRDTLIDDPLLCRIVEAIHEDVVKPGEIAARLGIPVAEIYNRRKQLQRRLTDFYQKWNAARSAEDGWPRRK